MKKRFDDKVADNISRFIGNMKFFYATIIFIVVCHIIGCFWSAANTWLLYIANDLQLALIALCAYQGAKQERRQMGEFKKIEAEEKKIETEVERERHDGKRVFAQRCEGLDSLRNPKLKPMIVKLP